MILDITQADLSACDCNFNLLYNSTFSEEEYNIQTEISIKSSILDDKYMVYRMVQIALSSLDKKIQNKIFEKLTEEQKLPKKISNKISDLYTINQLENNILHTIRPEIFSDYIISLENKNDKKFGVEIFEFKSRISKKIKISKIESDFNHHYLFKIFFEVDSIDAQIVEL